MTQSPKIYIGLLRAKHIFKINTSRTQRLQTKSVNRIELYIVSIQVFTFARPRDRVSRYSV